MAFSQILQAPKPPESSERRASRDKGPAPPPPTRQDLKHEEKENAAKVADKASAIEVAEKRKSLIEKAQLQNHERAPSPKLNGENVKQTDSGDTVEKKTTAKANIPEDSIYADVKPKKKHQETEEKRKSAPVTSNDEWRKFALQKQSSLEGNTRLIYFFLRICEKYVTRLIFQKRKEACERRNGGR